MWKDFVAINGSECVRALICIAKDDPLGGGRREQSSSCTHTDSNGLPDSFWTPLTYYHCSVI